MWLINARRHEFKLQDQDQDLRELRNEDDFQILFSCLFSSDRHPSINFPKLWNDFSYPEINSIAHRLKKPLITN